jgi:DNA-binding MarR family transcriptional regulator
MAGRIQQSRQIAAIYESLYRRMYAAPHSRSLVPAQWALLRYFAIADDRLRSVTGVAAHLGVTKGPASRAISALERRGLLTSRRHPDDARLLLFDLTRSGRAILTRDPQRQFALLVSRLPAPEFEGLERALRRLELAYDPSG